MKYIDVVILALYTFLCCFNACLAYNIKHNEWNSNLSFLMSFVFALWTNFYLKNLNLSLVKFSTYTDIICFTSYYIVYFLCGIPITTQQLLGIGIMLIGLLIANFN